MNDWIILAVSAGGVALMVAVAALLGFRDRAHIDAQAMLGLAAGEGAHVDASIIDARGLAGIARLGDGKWLVARAMADGVGARVFAADAVRVRSTRTGIKLVFDDIGYPTLTLRLNNEAPDWLQQRAA